MIRAALVGGLIVLAPLPIGRDLLPAMIVWNVGQGQWISRVTSSTCDHFDMGGEFSPQRSVANLCHDKSNRLWLSHWDWDHMSFVGSALKLLPSLCAEDWPEGHPSHHKLGLKRQIKGCQSGGAPSGRWIFVPRRSVKSRSNDLSRVARLGRWLIPGDSTRSAERIWSQSKELSGVTVLVLGHHGSRTSTSAELLAKLPHLKQAIVSARKVRYGHPHLETLTKIKALGVSALDTETWGTIMFNEPEGEP